MPGSGIKAVLGIVAIVGLAACAAIAGDDCSAAADSSLAQACAGLPASHRIENALFNMRAQSNGGADPICGAIDSQVENDPRLLR